MAESEQKTIAHKAVLDNIQNSSRAPNYHCNCRYDPNDRNSSDCLFTRTKNIMVSSRPKQKLLLFNICLI
jgi:hypothetical protein